MQAVRGLFNSNAERLIMQDEIRVSTSSGVTGKMTHARLEMRTQTLRSHSLSPSTASGTVRANALTFHSADRTLLFRGKVHVHIIRDQTKTAKPAGPALPEPTTVPPLPQALPRQDAGASEVDHNERLATRLRGPARRIVPSIMLGLAILASASVDAQTVTNTFGGFSKNSDEPIDIESDVLVVHDKHKLATFKGNVKAVQGTTTLRASELDVHYSGGNRLTKGGAETPKAIAQAPRRRPRIAPAPQRRPRETTAPRSARSRPGAMSSSPARTIRPRRAIGRFTTCPPRW